MTEKLEINYTFNGKKVTKLDNSFAGCDVFRDRDDTIYLVSGGLRIVGKIKPGPNISMDLMCGNILSVKSYG